MSIRAEIEEAFKKYLTALYTRDFKQMYASLYEDDVQNYRDKILEFAYKMDEFGESQEFINKLGFKSIEELEKRSLYDFMASVLQLVAREIGPDHLDKIIAETEVIDIDETEYCSIVSYQYPISVFDEWELYKGSVQMIKSDNEWKIFFKAGLDGGLSRFQYEIDSYYERKRRDDLGNLKFAGDLIKFSIVGYKDLSTGTTVIEPRFNDAGDFENGRAYVQIMKKYGYIDKRGDLVIKPQFIAAKDFSQKRAAVKLETEDGERWGFINKKGEMVIRPQFTNTASFSGGLCAVSQDGKWGYINKKGELVIPYKFDTADDFSFGVAYVEIYNDEGEPVEFVLDKKGNIEEVD